MDPSRICLWGTSGGGYPTAWAAIFGDPRPRCVVTFSASLDADWAPDRNPAAFVDADTPPFFVARGAFDDYGSVMSFVEAAEAAGVPVTYEEHRMGAHAFENERDPEQRRIIRLALRFLVEHLAG